MTLHRAMLLVILFAGFGLGLSLPTLRRNADIRHAREALHLAEDLARAERAFFNQNGFYTADFSQLDIRLPVHPIIKEDHPVLPFEHYTIDLEEANQLHVRSDKYPQWVRIPLDGGRPVCEFDTSSPVGEKICREIHL